MVKKPVPEWLNSSLWSAPPSSTSSPSPADDDLPQEHSISKPATSRITSPSSATTSNSGESTIQHPVRVPSPVSIKEDTQKSEIKGFRNNEDNGSSVADEISLQTQLVTELSRKVIDLRELRRLASQGIRIPDVAGIRSTVWKLLLGYLPSDRAVWSTELAKKRSQYKHYKDDLLMNPSEITRRLEKSTPFGDDKSVCEISGFLSRSRINHGEHPLSLGKTSVWNQFFQGNETREQIDRDVHRTYPDMHFFSGDSPFAKSNREALRNILLIFAKLNPGIKYVQGMHEVLAPLFYVFRNDPNEEMAVSAEADTFFCFVELLSEFRDHYCNQLDNSIVGIRSTISKFSMILKEHDEELWRHLEVTNKVNPQFYAFRWITLLLTREFNFTDVLHIWDTLLSDTEGPLETLLRVCCAMVILVRRRLLAGDFTFNLKLLQNYPTTNVNHLLYVANKLRTRPLV